MNYLDINNYTVIRSARKTFAIQITPSGIIIRVPQKATSPQVSRFLNENSAWLEAHISEFEQIKAANESVSKLSAEEIKDLSDRARNYIPDRVAYYAPIVGVSYGRITIRCQRTRWGSCSSKSNLNFNCLLMLMPEKVIDSVIVHELCHIKEMNHSRFFYNEVLRVLPDYRESEKWLKKNGKLILARLNSSDT